MKLFNLNWNSFFTWLGPWRSLSVFARQSYLQHAQYPHLLPRHLFAENLPSLLDAKFLIDGPNNITVKIPDDFRWFVRTLRALRRHPIFPKPDFETLKYYLHDHFSRQELEDLARGRVRMYGIEPLMKDLTSETWLENFLAEDDAAIHRSRFSSGGRYFLSPDSVKNAKHLLQKLMAGPNPIAMSDLPGLFSETNRPSIGEPFLSCLGSGLVFPGLREDFEPIAGIWPGIFKRLHKIPALPPEPVHPTEIFEGPFLMRDATELLVAAAIEPLALRRSDDYLMSRIEKKILPHLMPLPDWMIKTYALQPESRLRLVQNLVIEMNLARIAEKRQKGPFLEATHEGTAWINLPEKQRLQSILDRIRNPVPKKDEYYYGYSSVLEFLPFHFNFSDLRHDPAELSGWLGEAFGSIPENVFVRLKDFMAYRTEQDNPLVKAQKKIKHPNAWGYRPRRSAEDWDKTWAELLSFFLATRLIPLGGAKVGICNDSMAAFSLNPVGRYLLDLSKELNYEVNEVRQIIVQPNFDIAFLAPSPSAEVQLGRFAQRTGMHMGVVFQITRESIHQAAASGLSQEAVLQTLRQFSTKPVPANVEHEIWSWFGQTRRIALHPAYVIHCPDPETAAKVLSLGKGRVAAITPTILELTPPKTKPEFIKKLRSKGIFLEEDR